VTASNVYNTASNVYVTASNVYATYANTIIALNTANSIIQSANSFANTVNLTAQTARNTANDAFDKANIAFDTANGAFDVASNASNTSNAVLITVSNASDAVNAAVITVNNASDTANDANDIANIVITTINNAFDAANDASVIANTALAAAQDSSNLVYEITNDTSNDRTLFISMFEANTGTPNTAVVSDTKLYYNPSTGQLSAVNFDSLSDINKKTDIETIQNAIDLVTSLRGVTFKWKDNGNKSMGLIAQEVESVVPEVVVTNELGDKSVTYGSLIGLLVESIKELNIQVEYIKKIYK
jgi:hypothetical protein